MWGGGGGGLSECVHVRSVQAIRSAPAWSTLHELGLASHTCQPYHLWVFYCITLFIYPRWTHQVYKN